MSCSSSYGGAEHIRACKVHGFTIGHVGRFRVSGTSTRSLTRARVVPCQTKPWRALRFRVQDGRWQRARGCPRHRPSAVRHPPAAVGAAGQPPACQPVWCMQAGRRAGGRPGQHGAPQTTRRCIHHSASSRITGAGGWRWPSLSRRVQIGSLPWAFVIGARRMTGAQSWSLGVRTARDGVRLKATSRLECCRVGHMLRCRKET